MYKSEYQSPFRCHTVEECLEFPLTPNTKDVDLFLYLLDTYDLAHANLTPPYANVEKFGQLALKLRTYLMYHYEALRDAIPGRLKFWSKGMFVYVVACAADQIALRGAPGVMVSEEAQAYVTRARVRAFESWHTGNLTYGDMLRAYETLQFNWHRVPWDPALGAYLEALRARSSWLVTHVLAASIADVVVARIDRQADESPLHPHALYDLMAYDMGLHRSQFLRSAWPEVQEEMPENYFDNFYDKERRHLEVRKFRDKLGSMVNEAMLLPGERDVCGYRQRSNEVSAYAALALNRPLFLLDSIAKLTQYGTEEKLCERTIVEDMLHLNQLGMHFQGLYNIQWMSFFLCFEEKLWKHMKNLATTTVPFIVERSGVYDVMWRNQVHVFGARRARDAIIGWAHIVRRDCGGVVYGGIDLQPFCAYLLDPPVVKEVNTSAYSYKWD